MQQRQPRLGDILDDYCPRERRVTNHAVVAMIGEDVKQTRCTTCDADHEYKHAKVPRQRRKDTPTALQPQTVAGGPKRVVHEVVHEAAQPAVASSEDPPTTVTQSQPMQSNGTGSEPGATPRPQPVPEPRPEPLAAAAEPPAAAEPGQVADGDEADVDEREDASEGPAHRRLIRATLPRIEGQPPPTRPGPDFTIRQPNNSRQRFRNPRGMSPFQNSNRSGNAGGGDGMSRQGGRRPPMAPRQGPRHGGGHPQGGRKRSK
jgi:hypothetical protein